MPLEFSDPQAKSNIDFLRTASLHSYEDLQAIVKVYSDQELNVELIEDTDSDGQAIVISCPAFILVAFRGTEILKWKDIRTDLNCFTTQTPLGRIHRGFYFSFEKLKPKLYGAIDGIRPIFITGHSLGGALAQIFATSIAFELKINPVLVVTFAQPRVGSFKYASKSFELLGERHIRIVKNLDVVPRLPPYFFFFVHPKMTAFKRSKNGTVVDQTFLDRHCWNIGFPIVVTLCVSLIYLTYLVLLSHAIAGY